MTRFAFALVALAACDVGEVPPVGGVGVDSGVALACVDRGTAGAPHDHGGGVTHAGEACIATACHLAGGGGPNFSAMGTVYKADGTTPNAGAAVRLAFGGMTKIAITDTAGNFHFSETLAATYPLNTDTSACPTNPVKMVTIISGAIDMNCNRASGCHEAVTNRIKLE